MADPYCPIACGLHDRLEDLAVRRVRERLLLRDAGGELREVNASLLDLFAAGGEEFARLSNGEVVRLDHLVEIG